MPEIKYDKPSLLDKLKTPFHKIVIKNKMDDGPTLFILEKKGEMYIMVEAEQRGDIGNFIFRIEKFREINRIFEDMVLSCED